MKNVVSVHLDTRPCCTSIVTNSDHSFTKCVNSYEARALVWHVGTVRYEYGNATKPKII